MSPVLSVKKNTRSEWDWATLKFYDHRNSADEGDKKNNCFKLKKVDSFYWLLYNLSSVASSVGHIKIKPIMFSASLENCSFVFFNFRSPLILNCEKSHCGRKKLLKTILCQPNNGVLKIYHTPFALIHPPLNRMNF